MNPLSSDDRKALIQDIIQLAKSIRLTQEETQAIQANTKQKTIQLEKLENTNDIIEIEQEMEEVLA